MIPSSPKIKAIRQAIIVTILWSTSWVLIKFTLDDIPPLVFAGLRYTFASIFLLPGIIRQRKQLKTITGRDWIQLTALGLIFYTVAQGGLFLTLNHLNASTVSLLLNFSSVIVAILGIFLIREIPSLQQWAGVGVFIGGVVLFFSPLGSQTGRPIGFLFAAITVLANALASLLGRKVNKQLNLTPAIITGVSMGIGSVILLAAGVAVEGLPKLSIINVLTLLWLAVVNTAFAFQLWNRSLQELSAVESSLINNSMLIQIAFLSWIFLDEQLAFRQVIALVVVASGIALTNISSSRLRKMKTEELNP